MAKAAQRGRRVARTSRKQIKWRWRDWYTRYFKGEKFPNEAGEGFVVLFKSLIKSYPANYFSPDLVRVERRGVIEEFYVWFDEEGNLGDGAQKVILNTLTAWIKSKKFLKEFEGKQWTDKQIHFYVRRIMEREIRRIRHERTPTAWWWMYNLMQRVATQYLHCVNQFRKLYVPATWLKAQVPKEKHFEQLEAELNSLPRWQGEMPKRLEVEVLYHHVIEKMFDHVKAPIPLGVLVTHALKIFVISPNHPILLEWEERNGVEGEGEKRGRPPHEEDLTDPQAEWDTVSVTVADWLEKALGALTVQHLLVIKFRTCDALTLVKVARLVREILAVRRFGKSTAANHYEKAARLFRRPLEKGTRIIPPGFPTSKVEQEVFCKLLCILVHERLAKTSHLTAAEKALG